MCAFYHLKFSSFCSHFAWRNDTLTNAIRQIGWQTHSINQMAKEQEQPCEIITTLRDFCAHKRKIYEKPQVDLFPQLSIAYCTWANIHRTHHTYISMSSIQCSHVIYRSVQFLFSSSHFILDECVHGFSFDEVVVVTVAFCFPCWQIMYCVRFVEK